MTFQNPLLATATARRIGSLLVAGVVLLLHASPNADAFEAGPGPWQEVPGLVESIDIGDQFPPAFIDKLEVLMSEWAYCNYYVADESKVSFNTWLVQAEFNGEFDGVAADEYAWMLWSFAVIEAYHGEWWID